MDPRAPNAETQDQDCVKAHGLSIKGKKAKDSLVKAPIQRNKQTWET